MATRTITIHPDFYAALGQFSQRMKTLLANTGQFQAAMIQFQQSQVKATQIPVPQVSNTMSTHFKRLGQWVSKLETTLQGTTERMLQVLPRQFRVMVNSITKTRIDAILGDISPILRFIRPGMGMIGGALGVPGLIGGGGIAIFLMVVRFFYNMTMQLAEHLRRDYGPSLGLGISISGLRAFRTGFMNLPEDPLFMQSMVQVRGDAVSRKAVVLHNVLHVRNVDNLQNMIQAMIAAQRFMQAQVPGMELQRARTMGLTTIFSDETLMRLQHMTREELEREAGWAWAHRADMAPAPEATHELLLFQDTMKNFQDNMFNAAIKILSDWGVIDNITKFYKAIDHWVSEPNKFGQIQRTVARQEHFNQRMRRVVSDLFVLMSEEFEALLRKMRQWAFKLEKLNRDLKSFDMDAYLAGELPTVEVTAGGRRGLAIRVGIERRPGESAVYPGTPRHPGRVHFGERVGTGAPGRGAAGTWTGGQGRQIVGAGGITAPTRGPLRAGAVNSSDLYNEYKKKFAGSNLDGYVPKDGAAWGIKTGSPDEWARLAVAVSKQESNLNSFEHGGGLNQFEANDLARYGVSGNVSDPNAQVQALVNQWTGSIKKDGYISGNDGQGHWYGASAYFGSMRAQGWHGKSVPDVAKYLGPWSERMQQAALEKTPAETPPVSMEGARGAARLSVHATGSDPRLENIARETSKYLPEGWHASIESERRPGSPGYHGSGRAIDVQLWDEKGRKVNWYQHPDAFPTYQSFAHKMREVQHQMYPDMDGTFRWGGYFAGGAAVGPGRSLSGAPYGAMDLMHFDEGPSSQMLAGSWQGGLNQYWAQRWGLRPGLPTVQLTPPAPVDQVYDKVPEWDMKDEQKPVQPAAITKRERVYNLPDIPSGMGGYVADQLKGSGIKLTAEVEASIRAGRKPSTAQLDAMSDADLDKAGGLLGSSIYSYKETRVQPKPETREEPPAKAGVAPVPPGGGTWNDYLDLHPIETIKVHNNSDQDIRVDHKDQAHQDDPEHYRDTSNNPHDTKGKIHKRPRGKHISAGDQNWLAAHEGSQFDEAFSLKSDKTPEQEKHELHGTAL